MPLGDAPLIASLPAHDIERAKRWYDEKLGLTPIMDLGPARPALPERRLRVAHLPDAVGRDRQAHARQRSSSRISVPRCVSWVPRA